VVFHYKLSIFCILSHVLWICAFQITSFFNMHHIFVCSAHFIFLECGGIVCHQLFLRQPSFVKLYQDNCWFSYCIHDCVVHFICVLLHWKSVFLQLNSTEPGAFKCQRHELWYLWAPDRTILFLLCDCNHTQKLKLCPNCEKVWCNIQNKNNSDIEAKVVFGSTIDVIV